MTSKSVGRVVPPRDWDDLTDYEQQCLINIYYNNRRMVALGLVPHPTINLNFLLPPRSTAGKRRRDDDYAKSRHEYGEKYNEGMHVLYDMITE